MDMLAKIKRIVNKKLIKQMSNKPCGKCDKPTQGETHHIVPVGAGGPDIEENMINLNCSSAHHTMAHTGEISREELFKLKAAEMGKPVEVIKEIVHKAWRFGIYEHRDITTSATR